MAYYLNQCILSNRHRFWRIEPVIVSRVILCNRPDVLLGKTLIAGAHDVVLTHSSQSVSQADWPAMSQKTGPSLSQLSRWRFCRFWQRFRLVSSHQLATAPPVAFSLSVESIDLHPSNLTKTSPLLTPLRLHKLRSSVEWIYQLLVVYTAHILKILFFITVNLSNPKPCLDIENN